MRNFFETPGCQARDYTFWEGIIDTVLQKTIFLILPRDLKKDLERIIVLVGEKIFYFFNNQKFVCWECRNEARTQHFYTFTSHGVQIDTCYSLHFKRNIPDDPDERISYLEDALDHCQENVVEKYQKEIIAMLHRKLPELNFNNRKDIVFNILCAWHFTHRTSSFEEFFLPDGDYILPLWYISEMFPASGIGRTANGKKYFFNKLNSLEVPIKTYFTERNITFSVRFDKRSYPSLNDQGCLYYLKCVNKMIREKRLHDIQNAINDLVIMFLPVWPFQPVFLQIMNFCFENTTIRLDYEFLLEFVMHNIGVQSRSKHPVHKTMYLQFFETLWRKAPIHIKLKFLAERFKNLFTENKKNPILKSIFSDEEIGENNKDSLNGLIYEKCEEMLENRNPRLIQQLLIKGLTTRDEFEEFQEKWIVKKMSIFA